MAATPSGIRTPRARIMTVIIVHSATRAEPLMNWTHVVETMPAVVTMSVTTQPTMRTPTQCGKPSRGVTRAPAPTICGIR